MDTGIIPVVCADVGNSLISLYVRGASSRPVYRMLSRVKIEREPCSGTALRRGSFSVFNMDSVGEREREKVSRTCL